MEKYVAGNQSMSEAIANMDKNLKVKIGKAEISQQKGSRPEEGAFYKTLGGGSEC